MICMKKRTSFNILREVKELSDIYPDLPGDDECFKSISEGRFTSLAFVKFVADRTRIKHMFAATLRVGRKHLWVLDELHKAGRLDMCEFAVGRIMKRDNEVRKAYKYYDDLERVCAANGWTVSVCASHAKVLLFDTDAGKFVLETSSNLNENPSAEQFSFEKDAALYDAYKTAFKEVMAYGDEEERDESLD